MLKYGVHFYTHVFLSVISHYLNSRQESTDANLKVLVKRMTVFCLEMTFETCLLPKKNCTLAKRMYLNNVYN